MKNTAKSAPRKDSNVKALDKALSILERIGELNAPIDLAGLSKKTRVPKTTLLRLLNSLKNRNFLLQDPKTKEYSLGWALIYLGKKAEERFNLARTLHPFLERLAAETGETASLVLRDMDTAVYVDQVVSSNFIRAVPSIATHLNLYCTASGKLFLSGFSEKELEDYLSSHTLKKLTPNSISESGVLRRECETVRKRGFSIDNEETELGGFCIAAPVLDNGGAIMAAFSITGPAERIRQKGTERLIGMALSVAREASKKLGNGGSAG